MSQEATFEALMERLRAGDPDAAQQVFQTFVRRLIGLARLHLDTRLRHKVDPEDVAQSALRSFFLRHAEGQYDLSSWDSLWSLLALITLRKCGRQFEYFLAARRDVRREQAPAATESAADSWQALRGEPTPDQALMLAETVEQLLRWLNHDRDRQILELSLRGYTVKEISAEVGRSTHTVRLVLKHIRHRLEQLRDQTLAGQ
jgi:RNA polymerase sigma-70 factor (ECF subfamily)